MQLFPVISKISLHHIYVCHVWAYNTSILGRMYGKKSLNRDGKLFVCKLIYKSYNNNKK